MFVSQTVAKQSRNAVMRCGARTDAGITACAVFQIDEQKILRFEQSLVQKIIEMKSSGNRLHLTRREARRRNCFDLLSNTWKCLEHEIEISRGNSHHIDRVERGARRSAFNRTEQSNLTEIIAATQISPHHFAARQRIGNTD